MAATILDSRYPQHERSLDWAPLTADLDPTADVHEEHTSDLAPTTVDVAPEVAPTRSASLEQVFDTQDDTVGASNAESMSATAQTDSANDQASGAPALAPGMILNDRYLLEAVLGCGGVATVYRARDLHSGSNARARAQVAIKAPRPELHDHARASVRITHEFEHTQALSHPNIVRVFELCTAAPPSFMTMELIEGQLLSTLLRDRQALPAALAHRILKGCGEALAHAHGRNIVHGDFKPGNVFITRDQVVKVIDFGAAATPASAESRIAAGTPAYASPEVLSGETPETRDDVFSFSCVAYQLLTGEHPFDRRSSLEARDEGRTPLRAWSLSASQWLALLTGLSWQREQRPRDIESLIAALAPEARRTPAPEAAAHDQNPAPHPLPDDIMPPQRSWGFFVFIACALAVTYLASQRQGDGNAPVEAAAASVSSTPEHPIAPVSIPAVLTEAIGAGAAASEASGSAANRSAATATPTPGRTPAAESSEISFEADRIVTSEGSVAAVFLIKRSQPLKGRIRVQWKALSGSADAGIDFASNASGSVEFADGQAQRAIYVPLRNDLLKEEDETFTVRLQSPWHARLGEMSSVEATIRDDD